MLVPGLLAGAALGQTAETPARFPIEGPLDATLVTRTVEFALGLGPVKSELAGKTVVFEVDMVSDTDTTQVLAAYRVVINNLVAEPATHVGTGPVEDADYVMQGTQGTLLSIVNSIAPTRSAKLLMTQDAATIFPANPAVRAGFQAVKDVYFSKYPIKAEPFKDGETLSVKINEKAKTGVLKVNGESFLLPIEGVTYKVNKYGAVFGVHIENPFKNAEKHGIPTPKDTTAILDSDGARKKVNEVLSSVIVEEKFVPAAGPSFTADVKTEIAEKIEEAKATGDITKLVEAVAEAGSSDKAALAVAVKTAIEATSSGSSADVQKIVKAATEASPEDSGAITAGAVRASPSKAAEIVKDVLAVNNGKAADVAFQAAKESPGMAGEIMREAATAKPADVAKIASAVAGASKDKAPDVAREAVKADPTRASNVLSAVLKAAPEKLSESTAAAAKEIPGKTGEFLLVAAMENPERLVETLQQTMKAVGTGFTVPKDVPASFVDSAGEPDVAAFIAAKLLLESVMKQLAAQEA